MAASGMSTACSNDSEKASGPEGQQSPQAQSPGTAMGPGPRPGPEVSVQQAGAGWAALPEK